MVGVASLANIGKGGGGLGWWRRDGAVQPDSRLTVPTSAHGWAATHLLGVSFLHGVTSVAVAMAGTRVWVGTPGPHVCRKQWGGDGHT